MKKIFYNANNLSDDDINEFVVRVKVLLKNSNNEVLLGYAHNDYQFPGGHVEDGEKLIDAVNREVLEETGIDLKIYDIEPFICSYAYYKDWPRQGLNRKIVIYYYEIITDLKPDLNKTSYTENEKDGNFELRYVSLDNVIKVLEDNAKKYGDKKGIQIEMINIFNIYFMMHQV